jgi:hypothetical protein
MSWVRWTGRNFDAGERTTPGWSGACRWACRWRCWWAAVPAARPLQPAAGAGLRRRAAVPDAGLPPVQPLLHRHPRRAGPRRRERGAPRCSPSGATSTPANCRAPRCCATSSSTRCWPRTAMSSASSSGSSSSRRWAWGRWARCSTAWPSSPAATGATASVRWTRRPTTSCWRCRAGCSRCIDHVPARLTAFGFAVVGNFEEAIGSWRRDAGPVAAPQRRHHPGRRRRCRGRAAGRRRGARASRPTAPRPSDAGAEAGMRRGAGLHRRRCRRSRAPAQRGRPGVALGGAVDAAGGAADAGQRARLKAAQAAGRGRAPCGRVGYQRCRAQFLEAQRTASRRCAAVR